MRRIISRLATSGIDHARVYDETDGAPRHISRDGQIPRARGKENALHLNGARLVEYPIFGKVAKVLRAYTQTIIVATA